MSPSVPAEPHAPSALGRLQGALAESPPLWWALLYFFSLLCGYYLSLIHI